MTERPQPVVDRLRDLILSGAIAQGEPLREVPTAARLGISRTPLRPALAVLAQEGLLQPRGARGFTVRPVSRADMMDAFLVRANLEGLACGLVAQAGLSPDARARFEDILRHGDALLAAKDDEDFRRDFRSMNEAFHTGLLEATGNACLIELAGKALARPLLSSRVVHFGDPTALVRSHDDHWAILDAIVEREIERAKALMTEHILRSRDILRRQFAARDA